MAHTHIQPAEPTTLGYRFAMYAQDLLEDYRALVNLITNLRGKGLKGRGRYTGRVWRSFYRVPASARWKWRQRQWPIWTLPYYPIASQTYTRQQDLRLQHALSGIAASLHKFALDFRIPAIATLRGMG
ncbi:MAG: lyase family protein [Chloroflexota bacterium]